MGSGALKYITPLVRYDFMSDHSDGYRYLNGEKNENGVLKISDYKRSRLTGGLTFSFAIPFVSDIRLNFEKYFYRSGAIAIRARQNCSGGDDEILISIISLAKFIMGKVDFIIFIIKNAFLSHQNWFCIEKRLSLHKIGYTSA